MGKTTGISWTDASWNPWQGCQKVSKGCHFCYMYRDKKQYGQDPTKIIRSKDATFYAPLKWEKQAQQSGQQMKVFTCSWSDFFIEEADCWRDEAFAIMALTPHLTYQVLTKRPERIAQWLVDADSHEMISAKIDGQILHWPLQNIWIGVSIENQATADERIPVLLNTPAAVRFISYEPALEAVDFRLEECWLEEDCYTAGERIAWIICGGESGPSARPCQLSWLKSCVDQCQSAGVTCFVKQLGSNAYGIHQVLDLNTHSNIICSGCIICRYKTKHSHGADPSHWPQILQVQQFPE